MEIDEEALTKVADTTGGRYFRAEDADQLVDVLTDLPREFTLREQEVEVTFWFVLAASVLVIGGLGLSLWWNRVPLKK